MVHPLRLTILSGALGAVLATTTAMADSSGPHVYIPTGDGAEVVIVDGATGVRTGRIAGLPAAHGLAVTPDGSRLVVGSFAERMPGAAAPEKPAGMTAVDHAAHHGGGSAPEAPGKVSVVSIVDTASRTVIRRIEVPGAVHHVAMSPDGNLAAVTHPGNDAVTAIDLETFEVVQTVETGALPNYAAFSTDGARLYVSNAGEDTIAVVDTGSWSITGRIEVGESPEHLALSPDGRRLFVNNVADGSISIVDLATQRVSGALRAGDTPHGIDVSDDGKTVYVALRGEEMLTAIDLATRTRRSTRLAPAPYHMAAIRGVGALYVSSAGESRVWVIDAVTLEVRSEFAVPGIGHQFGQASGS